VAELVDARDLKSLGP